MARALSSSIMAALVVVALFWGNCFSCPQMMLGQQSKTSHDCCKRGQKPAPSACSSQSMHSFVKADSAATTAPVLASAPVESAVDPVGVWHALETATAETPHAPPDLLALLSSFRI